MGRPRDANFSQSGFSAPWGFPEWRDLLMQNINVRNARDTHIETLGFQSRRGAAVALYKGRVQAVHSRFERLWEAGLMQGRQWHCTAHGSRCT